MIRTVLGGLVEAKARDALEVGVKSEEGQVVL
jgi:hypothetical protein